MNIRGAATLVAGVVMCGAGAVGAAPHDDGIALRHAEASAPVDNGARVELVGIDAKGRLLDLGTWTQNQQAVVAGDRVTGLPAGKVTDGPTVGLLKGAAMVVVVVDANRPAKSVQAAIASIDPVCVGFAVSVHDKLGILAPTPCPAFNPLPATSEMVALTMLVKPTTVTIGLSRVNERTTVPTADVGKKLAEEKRSTFFEGKGCLDTGKIDDDDAAAASVDDHSGGTGTAMALDEGHMMAGRCDVLIAFDDAVTFGGVIDTFATAIASGFTSPRWMSAKALPPSTTTKGTKTTKPPAKPTKPTKPS